MHKKSEIIARGHRMNEAKVLGRNLFLTSIYASRLRTHSRRDEYGLC